MTLSNISRRGFLGASLGASAVGTVGLQNAQDADSSLASPNNFWNRIPLLAARQHVIYSYSGLVPPAELFEIISQGTIGGIIFFGENISSIAQIASVAQQLQEASLAGAAKRRLMLKVDQEGGYVNRLPGGPKESAAVVGRATDPAAAAAAQASTVAIVLATAKMNSDLAPVLGVYRKYDDFLDHYDRSFSQDPAIVSNCGESFIRTLNNAGVISSAKHFPGLGAAPQEANTDLVPVTIDLTEAELRRIDLFPYHSAIKAGVPMVMPSWAIYPAFGPAVPAGFSKKIVSGLLRNELGFKGVTVTDALEAGSLKPFGGPAERAVKALQAGNDLLCCSSRSLAQGEEAAQGLVSGFKGGKLDLLTLLRSQQRISKLASKIS